MASENLMKKLQQGLFYKQMEMQEMQHEVQMTNIAIQGASTRQQAQAGIGQLGLTTKSAQDAAEIGAEGGKATIVTMFGISEGASKIIAALGYFGIPLIGVITSILMGLLNSAKATAAQETASASSATSAAKKTRVVSGMLTYDEGNIGTYQGTDGQSYRATAVSAPGDGLVTRPIATTVQGQPALVAERGPEIVIGRRTTKAIMMNEPGLIKYLANYGKGASAAPRYRAFDEGNIDTLQLPDAAAQPSATDAEMRNTLAALTQVVGQLQKQLDKGIKSTINMYGSDGLYENMNKANKFMGKYNG
jgi:hypothetical protein